MLSRANTKLDRIYQINLAIAGIAIGVVILPQLSKYVQLKKKNKILLVQNKALELSIFLSFPATLALIIGSEEIISALFGYGSFDETAIKNSALALYYFSFGLPAFAFIKVFSSFFFANHNTKLPFYISFVSVLLNVVISVYYFKDIGFIIIPIATSISSWFNSIILFFYLKKENLFHFEKYFIFKFLKISFASSMMCLFFDYLISNYGSLLTYSYNLKLFYLILFVILAFIFYLLVSIFIKAFKYQDLKLKY